MDKPKAVKINLNDHAQFIADALARHFTEEVMKIHKEDYKTTTEQKPA
jgi:hypothetical protein